MTSLSKEAVAARLSVAIGWEAKNRLLVQLARELPTFPESSKNDANRVAGCESQVWMQIAWQGGHLQLAAASDSRVVQGLLALVFACYQGKTPAEIRMFYFEGWLAELGLMRFLSASRGSGLKAIVNRIYVAASQFN